MTSPSNFSLTSNPVLAFTKETFEYTSPRVAHGFAFTDNSGNVDDTNVLIFESLQLDNLFKIVSPWGFYLSFPLDSAAEVWVIEDLGQYVENDETWAIETKFVGSYYNTVVRIASFPSFVFQVQHLLINDVRCADLQYAITDDHRLVISLI